MPIYQPGDTVTIDVEIRVDDVLTDPGTIALEVVSPAGVSTNYPSGAITRDSLGLYHVDHPTTVAGLYRFRWTLTGAAAGIDEGEFMVQPSLLTAPMLCSVEDVRQLLDTPSTNDTLDDLISVDIARVTKLFEKTAEREFAPRGELTRTFAMEDGTIDLNPYDLQTASVVTLAAPDSPSTAQTLVLDSDYLRVPENGTPEGTYLRFDLANTYSRFTSRFGMARATITGVWGMPAVPRDIELAAAGTVALWLRRDVQAFSSTFVVDEGRLERPESIPSAHRATVLQYARWGV